MSVFLSDTCISVCRSWNMNVLRLVGFCHWNTVIPGNFSKLINLVNWRFWPAHVCPRRTYKPLHRPRKDESTSDSSVASSLPSAAVLATASDCSAAVFRLGLSARYDVVIGRVPHAIDSFHDWSLRKVIPYGMPIRHWRKIRQKSGPAWTIGSRLGWNSFCCSTARARGFSGHWLHLAFDIRSLVWIDQVRRQDQYQCSHSPLMETTPKAQNHILGLQKRGEGTDIDSKIPLDEICLSALSGRTAAGQPPLEFRHRELGRISTSQWSAWNIILGQFEAYIHLQEKVGTVRSEQNQVSNTKAEQVHDEGCDRCRRWYRWWVGQSRTPIRVAVTSSDAGHDVKCKRTFDPFQQNTKLHGALLRHCFRESIKPTNI